MQGTLGECSRSSQMPPTVTSRLSWERRHSLFCSQVSHTFLLSPPLGIELWDRGRVRGPFGATWLLLCLSSPAQDTVVCGAIRGPEHMSLHYTSLFFPGFALRPWLWLGFWIPKSEFYDFVVWILLWVSNRLAAALMGEWQNYYSKILSHY